MVQESNIDDPFCFEEAKLDEKWRRAMQSEMESIERNNTWSLTDLPQGCVDYSEIFAPVARMDTVRMILSGEIEEDVYVAQPPGLEVKRKEYCVYKLQKALYGLKQALRVWFSKIETHFVDHGFKNSESEQTLFTKRNALFTKRNEKGNIIIASVYVDDLIFIEDDQDMMTKFRQSMVKVFDMIDLGSMNYFLGIEVKQTKQRIFICQKKYSEDILKRFGMTNCNSVLCPILPGTTIDKDIKGSLIDETYYKQIVGSLMYLTNTRPDMTFSVSILSRFMSRPTEIHLQLAKRVLKISEGDH
ncbi:transmembrane signal receptor [Lithospermum erythrorhizon]|uniref:Transmembrane signal receptor n=1 Tax=Lithospermum erythrorhizon TaxID=34254 RepID=A0AAV3QVH5_LITER